MIEQLFERLVSMFLSTSMLKWWVSRGLNFLGESGLHELH